MRRHVDRFPLPAAASPTDACEAAARQLISDIILFHAAVTIPLGGKPSLISPQLLDSAAHRPFSMFGRDFLYPTCLDQAAALLQSLTQNHAFEDANKRTAITSCLYFLDRCGYWQGIGLLTDRESHELEELTLLVATRGAHLKRGTVSLPLPIDVPHIAQALDEILGPSRYRKERPSRLLRGVFHQIGNLILPRGRQ